MPSEYNSPTVNNLSVRWRHLKCLIHIVTCRCATFNATSRRFMTTTGLYNTTQHKQHKVAVKTATNYSYKKLTVYAQIEGTPKIEQRLNRTPYGRGTADPLQIHPSHLCYLPNLVVLGQTVLWRSLKKMNFVSRVQRSLQVISPYFNDKGFTHLQNQHGDNHHHPG